MINITDTAREYLETMTDFQGKKYAFLSVNGGGCSGFQYKWEMTDDDSEGTLIEDILVLDKMAEMYVIGCTVDYIKDFGGSYLTVVNPNAKAMCGCGTSFAI